MAPGRAAFRPLFDVPTPLSEFPDSTHEVRRRPCGMSSPRLTRGRISEHGRIYTVTTVCHRRRPLFLDTFVVGAVTRELRRLADDGIAENHAWVLMPDHLHWLFGLRNCALPECMQLLKGRSARSINRVLDGHGAVWQAGYFDHALRDDDCVRKHARYIIENPVRAGLVQAVGEYAHVWCAWDMTGE
jgi:putative transposase